MDHTQGNTTLNPREHCPPDVEPAAYIRVLDREAGGFIPVTLYSAETGIYLAWAHGKAGSLTVRAATLRRWFGDGRAVYTLEEATDPNADLARLSFELDSRAEIVDEWAVGTMPTLDAVGA